MNKNKQRLTLLCLILSGLYGCGGDSDSSSQKTDTTKPNASNILTVTAVAGSGSKLDVSWSEASDPGGSATAQLLYRLMVSDDGGNQWMEADSVVGATTATISYLRSNTLYKVGVIVEDEAGNRSEQSSANANDSATTNNMAFTADVYPILKTSCTGSNCHVSTNAAGNSVNPAAGLDLDGDVTSAYQALLNARQVSCGGLKNLINTSGNNILADSYLDDLLDPSARNTTPRLCSNPMPKNGPLADYEFAVIYDWLVDGVQN